MAILINKDLCTKCNTCATVCLMSIIEKASATGFPKVPEERDAYCLHCGHCESFCPELALTLNFLVEEKDEHPLPGQQVDSRDLAAFMKMRRTVRHFQNKPVPKDLIRQALEVARYAPSGGNGQPVKWQVMYEASDVRRVAELTIDWMRTLLNTDHPLAAYVPTILSIWDGGREYICHSAPHLLIAHLPNNDPTNDNTDAVIAMAHFDLAATLFGFHTCWAGFVSMAAAEYQPLNDFIALPEHRRLAFAMVLGYSKYPITAIPRRNPVDVTWK